MSKTKTRLPKLTFKPATKYKNNNVWFVYVDDVFQRFDVMYYASEYLGSGYIAGKVTESTITYPTKIQAVRAYLSMQGVK